MNFIELQKKGLDKFLLGENIDPQKLSIHISAVEPGNRSHAAHAHTGLEAFYVFEGEATVEIDGERHPIGVNESLVLDASVPHGIFNSGSTRTRYMVIIAQ